MDANGSRYHLVMGPSDWARVTDDALKPIVAGDDTATRSRAFTFDTARNEVTLRPLQVLFPRSKTDRRPSLDDRRGAARDTFGNWFVVSADRREVIAQAVGNGTTSRFWTLCADEADGERPGGFEPVARSTPATVALAAAAVTSEHYLVVGSVDPKGLLIFDLAGGNVPRWLRWPADVDFEPFDMVAWRDGVAILDQVHRRYWLLDRHFRAVSDRPETSAAVSTGDAFTPVDVPREPHARRQPCASRLSAHYASAVEAADPIAIEALPDGSVLILDRDVSGASRLERYRFGTRIGPARRIELPRDLVEAGRGTPLPVRAHDFAFTARYSGPDGTGANRLYVVGEDGNQALVFELEITNDDLRLHAQGLFVPMRRFTGVGVVAGAGRAWYDSDGAWVPLIAQRRARFVEAGVLLTPVFDGKTPDCVWHRLMLDACLPAGTHVQVSSRAANDREALARGEWTAEPPLYARHRSELPFATQPRADRDRTWELLFQRARGRFAQIRLEVAAGGNGTPRIRALRAWYPRFSYSERYLPAAYREDPQSASFIERFLANFEGVFTSIEDRIAVAQLLFDSRSAPADAMPWLASWFGVALDRAWDDERRRLFVRHAMTFFQWRGTTRGLLTALHLALNPCADESLFAEASAPETAANRVRIVERFRTRSVPAALVGDPTDTQGPRIIRESERWTPDQGRGSLHARYRQFVTGDEATEYPLRAPSDPTAAEQWRTFAQRTLGFVPSATAADAAAWREFLQRRYRRVGDLPAEYGPPPGSFAAMPLPVVLPADGAPLRDWYQFEAVVVATRLRAHRFTLLIPASLAGAEEDRDARLELVRRVVDLEKPAHTAFDTRFFWSVFRVGEARIGLDTMLGQGGRVSELTADAVLGHSHVGESFVGSARSGAGMRRRELSC